MEPWFVFSLLTAFLWGFGNIFAKVSTPKLGVARVAALIMLIEGVMYLAGFFLWHNNATIDLTYFVLAIASAIFGVAAYVCFFESVMEGQVAIVGTISAAYPCLTVIGALAFMSESPTGTQLIGVAAIILGIVALTYEPNSNSRSAVPTRSLVFALLAFALWGLWSLSNKIVVGKIGVGNVFGFYVISTLTVPLIYVWYRRSRYGSSEVESSRTAWALGAIGLVLNVGGTYAFTFALSMGLASLVAPISSAYPIVTVVAALILLNEKLNRIQLAGLACVIAGLFMIAIVS
jgi:drug/metabolite transporter (DMT)-like permease